MKTVITIIVLSAVILLMLLILINVIKSNIKLKGDNYLSYDVETSSITMELVAKCLDSSEEKSIEE